MLAVIGLATVATGLHSAAASGVRAPHSPRDEEPTPIGTVVPRSAGEIRGSRWSVGLETQDRNYTVWDSYKAYVGPLGAKRGRLQVSPLPFPKPALVCDLRFYGATAAAHLLDC